MGFLPSVAFRRRPGAVTPGSRGAPHGVFAAWSDIARRRYVGEVRAILADCFEKSFQ